MISSSWDKHNCCYKPCEELNSFHSKWSGLKKIFIVGENRYLSFCDFAQLFGRATFVSAWDKSRDSWANSQKLTLEILKIPKINIFDDLLYKSQESKCFWKYAVITNNFIAHVHVSTLQLGEGIYQGERKLYLHFVCSLLISEGTQKVLRWQKLWIDLIKIFPSKLNEKSF